jgi:Fe-S-cluster-containing dehydrogenase component/DMSO reductase anchor subunit
MKTLIDEMLSEQSRLQTPVAVFSDLHDRSALRADAFRHLIPLTKPGKGEQYAFEVSLDRCTACKACVSACHSLNGLDDDETWRDVGILLGGDSAPAWQQTVTSACHHCEKPGCLEGCPVGAYEKDAETGIVRHLDDQCIGCSYCILKCPYDVPKYSSKRGIVRKCDMCQQRLAVGEAPACVQACPTEAIRIVTVSQQSSQSHITRLSSIDGLFSHRWNRPPQARTEEPRSIASPSITLPTTRYIGRAVPSSSYAADQSLLHPQHRHMPLALMLTLTQAGIGLILGSPRELAWLGALVFFMGMIASVAHLGQPRKAWRFFLGLKTSWLSREILAFSALAPVPLALAALPFVPDFPYRHEIESSLRIACLILGLVAVFTSVMIYHDTHRPFWHWQRGTIRFFGTVLAFAFYQQPLLLGAIVMLKMLSECAIVRHRHTTDWSPDRHSAQLLCGPLRNVLWMRMTLALLALALSWIHPMLSLPLLLAADLLERMLFFQAVQSPKMPGHMHRAMH